MILILLPLPISTLSLLALEDLLFRVEVHIMNGLYSSVVPQFWDTATVSIASPSRAQSKEHTGSASYPTRTLHPILSAEEKEVLQDHLFVAVYRRETLGSQVLDRC